MVDESKALDDLANLAERLDHALENEFSALKLKNVELIERCQREKIGLLEDIASKWDSLPSEVKGNNEPNAEMDRARAILKGCKTKHQRNDILLRRQIDDVKTLLNALTSQKNSTSSSTYNKLGKIIR
jgi:flagellar biosynthesis/type III secretory pathway chaperone